MKINCGLSEDELYHIDHQERYNWIKEHEKWHPYFTFWPRRVGHRDCRWLEWIQRRLTDGGYYSPLWDYRPKQDK